MLTVTITRLCQNTSKVVGHIPGGKLIQNKSAPDTDYGALAAAAMNMAQQYGEAGYVILGPKKVMDLIPEQLRSKLT